MGETGEKKSSVNCRDPAVTTKVEWVEVYVASVTVADVVPSGGLATPNRLYVEPSTRAITDHISVLPAQNCALLLGSDAASLPGIHAVDQLAKIPGDHLINTHLTDKDFARPKDTMEAARENM